MPVLLDRPAADEYAAHYAGYVARVPEGDLMALLRTQNADTLRRLSGLDEARALHRYAPGKWSVKEVIQHLADAERVFAYRALRFARADATPLQVFDENAWAAAAGADRRPLGALLDEFAAVRAASLALFGSFDEAAWARRGIASGHAVSVRALGCIALGHEMHHLAILRERYGVGG